MQRILDARVEPDRPTKLTEQGLLRIGDVAGQCAKRALGPPHLRSIDDQAWLLGRLQGEL